MVRSISIVLAVILLIACDEPTGPPLPQVGPPARVVVRTALLRLLQGDTATLEAVVTDSAGNVVSDVHPKWLSANWPVASVSDSGRVHADAEGWTQLIARYGKSADTVWVAVTKRFTSIATGFDRACAITVDHALYCWGSSGRYSAVSITPGGSFATQILVANDAVQVTSGWDHTCRATTANTTICWGSDDYRQLGDGPGNSSLSATRNPVRVPEPLVSLTSGNYYTCGVAATENVYCWGINDTGELGTWPDTRNPQSGCYYACRDTAVLVPGVRLKSVSGRLEHTCGLTDEGTAWCWGANESGELGIGATGDTLSPRVVKTDLRFRSLAAGVRQTCGVAVDGTLYCWGLHYGNSPTAVATSIKFKNVSVHDRGCGLSQSDQLYCWSSGGVPALLGGDVRFTTVDVNEGISCALSVDGGVYCWGATYSSGTGLPPRSYPIMIAPPGPVPG